MPLLPRQNTAKASQALLLLFVAAWAQAANSATFSSPRLQKTNGLFEVCLSDWTPMVACVGLEPSQYTGYQVDLFQQVIARLQWTPDMYYYRCLDWQVMMDDLSHVNGTCYIAPAGVDLSVVNYQLGLKFTWPTYKQGLAILIAATVYKGNAFDVFKVFHWTVWVAIALTGVLVGLVLWVTENYGARLPFFAPKQDPEAGPMELTDASLADLSGPSIMSVSGPSGFAHHQHSRVGSTTGVAKHRRALLNSMKQAALNVSRLQTKGVGNMMWYSVANLVNMGLPDPVTLGGRLVMMAYGFLLLIMVNYWTANTAALVTTNRLSSTITSRSDLVGKAVGTWFPYVPALSKFGIAAAGFAWEDVSDERIMLNALLSGKVKALVLDSCFVKYTASSNCSFFVVGDEFNSWQLSWGFPAVTPDSDIDMFTTELINLQMTENVMDSLDDQFVERLHETSCTGLAATNNSVTFRQVAGLWIILGAAVALCLSTLGLMWWMRKRR